MKFLTQFFRRPDIVRAAVPAQTGTVHYTVSVLNADGSTARKLPKKRNLILDSGLDILAGTNWSQVFRWLVVGTGNTATKRDSGAITFTRAGSTVTASAGFFAAGDVGALLKFDSGVETYVTAYTSATQVTVSTAGAVAASQGTVWFVNQTGLAAETERSNTLGTDSGDHGSTWDAVGKAWTMKRTLLSPPRASAITFNELGWSNTGAAGNNLFGRDVITGGVNLAIGQQLKVVIELTVALSPSVSTPWAQVVAGWAPDGDAIIENPKLSRVGDSGETENDFTSLDPAGVILFYLSTASSALLAAPSLGGTVVAGSAALSVAVNQAYVTGSFQRDAIATFGPTVANRADWRSLIIGYDGGGGNVGSQFRILLDAAVAKTSAQQLSITLRKTWGRNLVN